MPSPFPGMDPFIESKGLWEDFHFHLISATMTFLASQLTADYVVRTRNRTYTLLTEEPRGGLIPEEFRESFVEIFALQSQRKLVTCIEFLTPTNKDIGSPGRDAYLRQRAKLLAGGVNLVEIDLVRRGIRAPMNFSFPESPYYMMVARKTRVPNCEIWPAHYRWRLPVIPIPLEVPDADIPVDLQPMIAAIYESSRYARDIDYTKPAKPPLPDEDQAWLQQQLAAKP